MVVVRAALKTAAVSSLFALMVMAVPASADNCGSNGNHVGNAQGCSPALSATPELGSLVLLGTGLAGAVGYGLMRVRAARRPDDEIDTP